MEIKNGQNKLIHRIRICLIWALIGLGAVITYYVHVVYCNEPTPFDIAIQNYFISMRGSALNQLGIFITHLSDTKVIISFCILLLLLPSRKKYGLPISGACLTGVAIYMPMKQFLMRERPDLLLHIVEQGGYSFPSGHSVTSMVFYGLSLHFIHKYQKGGCLKWILMGLCGFLAVGIGLTRIYVGVHWPTDVLAGWCIGGTIVALYITIIKRKEEKNENLS